MIRSYIFVRTVENGIGEVLQTPGCVGILKYLGHPAIVQDREIENLRILVNGTPESLDFIEPLQLAAGDPIEVIRGPFAGLTAEYVRMKGKFRVIVHIKALGTLISVDIPRINIKELKNRTN